MDDYATSPEPGAVRIERLLPGPIERVWAYRTESDKRGCWLAHGAFELKVGGRAALNFRHDELSRQPTPQAYRSAPCDFEGRITPCEPPRLISYTWNERDGKGSEVSFELEPSGSRVRLIITHRRLVGRDVTVAVAGGWHAHLGLLEDVLEGRTPRDFWVTQQRLNAEY